MVKIFISSVTDELSVLFISENFKHYKALIDKDFLVELPEIFTHQEILKSFANEEIEKIFILTKVGKLTGMRIGESFAKGLIAFDSIDKLVKFNTHDVMAFSAPQVNKIFSVFKIRKDSYSYAIFSKNNGFERITKDCEDSLEGIKSLISKEEYFIVGDGLLHLKEDFEKKYLYPDAMKMYQYFRSFYGKDNGFDSSL